MVVVVDRDGCAVRLLVGGSLFCVNEAERVLRESLEEGAVEERPVCRVVGEITSLASIWLPKVNLGIHTSRKE